MKNETAIAAIAAILPAMKEEAQRLIEDIETALQDIEEGRRNGAVGALTASDRSLEQLAASLSAIRSIHRTADF